jgi:predicted enzyme related to lactoylglutathione lyase
VSRPASGAITGGVRDDGRATQRSEELLVSSDMHTVIYPVTDLEAAKAVFARLLGTEPVMDQPYYVHFSAGGLELGLDPNGHAQGMTGPVPFWDVEDISARVHELLESGAREQRPVTDVGGGTLVAVVTDPDGNPIGLRQGSPS